MRFFTYNTSHYWQNNSPLLPRAARLLGGFGEDLKLARLGRKYSAESVAQRAGITRRMLSKVEQGDPGVALGIYARVMQVLKLEGDLSQRGVDDVLGRKLHDAGIIPKRRAPKRESRLSVEHGLRGTNRGMHEPLRKPRFTSVGSEKRKRIVRLDQLR